MSEFNYTQLPPDGTGKRVSTSKVVELLYDYASYGYTFTVGDVVTTTISGLVGDIIKIKGNEIYVLCTKTFDSSTLQPDNDKIQVDGVTYADYKELKEDINTQQVVLTGGNNTINKVSVSDQGALTTTFASGDMAFDAFGKLMTSESTTIREYQPISDTMPDEFDETTTLGSTIEWKPVQRVVELKTLSGATNAIARRRTNLYHKYQTGVATTVLFSAYIDAPRTGVERRIGIFDDLDGLFFHIGDSNIGVVVRSSVASGVPVETHYHQEVWNVDRLNGEGGSFNISGITLDPTKTQVMFIDYQWLGAGRVRFGFVLDGEYVVCHEINNANIQSQPYMRTGSLPLTFEQENTGTPSLDSVMYIISASVKCEGKFVPREWIQGGLSPEQVVCSDDTVYDHVLSFRASQTLDGQDNRSVSLPQFVHLTDVSGTNKPFVVEFVKNDTQTGTGTWSDPYPGNALESISPDLPLVGNVTSTTGGEVLLTEVVVGHETIDMTKLFGLQAQIIIRKADITATPDHYTLRARPAVNGDSVTVLAGMTWKEYR